MGEILQWHNTCDARNHSHKESTQMIDLKRILVPTDLSENSRPAITLATELAQNFRAELFLLYVVEPSGGLETLPDLPDNVNPGSVPQTAFARAELGLQSILDASVQDDLVIHRHVDIGKPAKIIRHYAESHEIDLIVIGTHGVTGWKHALLGSVAENVVHHAKCPVLTVRSHELTDYEMDFESEAAVPASPPLTRSEQTVE